MYVYIHKLYQFIYKKYELNKINNMSNNNKMYTRINTNKIE